MTIDDNIKAKFITGQCSDDELAAVAQWMRQDAQGAAELLRMERLYHEAQALAMPRRETEKALGRLNGRIEHSSDVQAGTQPAPPSGATAPRHTRVLRLWHRWAAAIAIVVVACVGLYGLRLMGQRQTAAQCVVAQASAQSPKQLTLPDGTRVWLNRGSELRYPRHFDDTLRQVTLKGEGYFEVTKRPSQPFVVESRDMKVKVLGTVFNFNTRPGSSEAEVSLIEGSVEVSSLRSAGQVVLMPGQKAQLTQAGQLVVRNADTRIDAVWHNELIPFNNCNVRQIANTLEQLYDVKIVVDENINRNETYSGQIMWKQDIDSVLSLLKNTLPISYHRQDGKVYITPQR